MSGWFDMIQKHAQESAERKKYSNNVNSNSNSNINGDGNSIEQIYKRKKEETIVHLNNHPPPNTKIVM